MMNIFITNLGKYNEGELVGKWIELPISDEDLHKALEEIGITFNGEPNEQGDYYEEYFITDYETDFGYSIGEYDSISELNEIAEQMKNMDDTEKDVYKAMLSEGYDSTEALEKVNNGDYMYYNDCSDMTDIAYQYIEETGMLQNVPENIARYFDYESFGRDMSFEGHYVFLDNGDCVEIL